jgi:hypothetical protein|tara:strand:- start:9147 stop:9353 length:207 start_codon:yes stop_codon:yes gene_type:complete
MRENTTNIYISLEDEMLKLLTLVENPKEMFSGEYMAEKIRRALEREPIILHRSIVHRYEMKKETYKNL